MCDAQLLFGLARSCLAASVVHTNIKPDNLLLVGNSAGVQQLRLIDVGCSFEPAAEASIDR